MSSKSIMLTDVVNAGLTDVYDYPSAIPAGKKWVINKFGAADIDLGDSISSVFVLRFGSDVIRILSLTGNTQEVEIKREIVGDGATLINIVRINKSAHNKELPAWVDGYERPS